MQIDIDAITADERLQPRVAVRPDVVAEYAALLDDAKFDLPAVTVFDDGAALWLADGWHRLAAYRQADRVSIPADVRSGTFRDALKYAASSNSGHGLRRSNADKRRAVLMLLDDELMSQWSNREIARHCGVHHATVAAVREEHKFRTQVLLQDASKTLSDGHTADLMQAVWGCSHDALKTPVFDGEIGLQAAAGILDALDHLPPDEQAQAIAWSSGCPVKARLFGRLYDEERLGDENGTWQELAATGGLMHGTEMEEWLDAQKATAEELQSALRSIARCRAALDADHGPRLTRVPLDDGKTTAHVLIDKMPRQQIIILYDVLSMVVEDEK